MSFHCLDKETCSDVGIDLERAWTQYYIKVKLRIIHSVFFIFPWWFQKGVYVNAQFTRNDKWSAIWIMFVKHLKSKLFCDEIQCIGFDNFLSPLYCSSNFSRLVFFLISCFQKRNMNDLLNNLKNNRHNTLLSQLRHISVGN